MRNQTRLTLLIVALGIPMAYSNLRTTKRQLGSSSMPKIGHHLANLGDASFDRDTPLFWHIPKAGGTSMHVFAATCLNLVVASEVGVTKGHDHDEELQIVNIGGNRYVNVDTTSSNGIVRAKELGFPGSGIADMVLSPRLTAVTENLFTVDDRGVLFALFRHPIDRAVSLYYYLQDAYWEKTYSPQLANMTFEEYAKSGMMGENWMVRFLVGKEQGPLVENDLVMAKTLLREKCLIGLMTEMETTMRRFGEYFGWDHLYEWDSCVEMFGGHASNSHKHPPVEPGSNEWRILARYNQMDLELYKYAVERFQQQGAKYFESDKPIE